MISLKIYRQKFPETKKKLEATFEFAAEFYRLSIQPRKVKVLSATNT